MNRNKKNKAAGTRGGAPFDGKTKQFQKAKYVDSFKRPSMWEFLLVKGEFAAEGYKALGMGLAHRVAFWYQAFMLSFIDSSLARPQLLLESSCSYCKRNRNICSSRKQVPLRKKTHNARARTTQTYISTSAILLNTLLLYL